MPRLRQDQAPAYRLHRQSGQAIVTLSGRDFLLGLFGTPDSRRRYYDLLAKWEANGRRPIHLTEPVDPVVASVERPVTVGELVTLFKRSGNNATRHQYLLPAATGPLVEVYGAIPARDFTAPMLKAVRDLHAKPGTLARTTVNRYTHFVRRIFKWGVSEALVPIGVYEALATVEGLKHHEYHVETAKRKPAPLPHVYALEQHVAKPVWGLIRLQLACGARGGELVKLRPVDIDTSGDVWLYRPEKHKTAWRGDERVIHFGPKAQDVIREFLNRPVDAFLFDPREGNHERQVARGTKGKARRPGQKPNARKSKRTIGTRYTSGSYRRAIERGCELAEVPVWTPHMLRHAFATAIRKAFGAESVGLMLGDKDTKMIDVYAERDHERALKIASEVG
jgi:integrase